MPGGSGGGCFASGTLVHTSTGLKSIEEVKIGDTVLAWNEDTAKTEYKRVVASIIAVRRDVVKLHIDTDEVPLIASANHKFYVKGKGWIMASEIATDDMLLDKNSTAVRIKAAEQELYPEEIQVYNFEVEGLHNYYVGKTGILTHNRGLKDPAFNGR